jgi:hypothetical protein
MQPISEKHKKIISSDPFFKRCLICKSIKIEIHHVWTYAGKQISELFNYAPLCKEHHTGKNGFHNNKNIKEKIEYIMILRMNYDDMTKYPKRNWLILRKYLENKYGKLSQTPVSKL